MTNISKNIEHYKKEFGRRIEQLDNILMDSSFLTDGGYRDFIGSMYQALVTGRKITPKMESAITKIVKSYAKQLKENNDPKLRKRKLDYIENTLAKLNMIKRRLDECNYTTGYKNEKLYFLESIEKQVHRRGSLSKKQRKALNGMYIQFTKKIEKNKKIQKKVEEMEM